MKKFLFFIFYFFITLLVIGQDNSTDINFNSSSSSSIDNSNKEKNNIKNEKNGWELYLEGKYFESIKALEKEKKSYPERTNIYVIEGWDYKYLNNFIEMERISLEGLKMDSEDSRITINLAEAYYFQNKYSQAIPVFEKYLSKRYNINDQAIQKIYFYLGDCYYNIKYYRKADIALCTAYYFIKNDVQIILKLALVNENLANKDKSIELLKKVLTMEPENKIAKEILTRLEK